MGALTLAAALPAGTGTRTVAANKRASPAACGQQARELASGFTSHAPTLAELAAHQTRILLQS